MAVQNRNRRILHRETGENMMTFKEFLKQFGIHEAPNTIIINRSYYKASKQPFGVVYAGELIAHQRGEYIIPSIHFLQKIAKQATKKVVVDDKGAWMFICGKDAFAKSIITHNAEPNDFVVVMNQHDECIGYGIYQEGRAAVIRKFDIGDLLRRERKQRF